MIIIRITIKLVQIIKTKTKMRNKKVKLTAIFLLGFGLAGLQAQEAVTASGGNASGSGGTVSYSVGQVFYTTNTSLANGSVAQGVQQPFEISVVTGLEEANGINLNCLVYPNPTTDYLQLKIENEKLTGLIYQLFDMNGKLIETKIIESNETSISMKNLLVATYFIKVMQNNKEIKTFKIIKN